MTPRASLGSALPVLLVAALLVIGAWAALPPARPGGSATLLGVEPNGAGTAARVQVRSGSTGLSVHAAALSMVEAPESGPVYLFSDPTFPELYATHDESTGILAQLTGELASMEPSRPVSTVGAGALGDLLEQTSGATLVIVDGVVPDDIWSNSTDRLAQWVAAGGTLVWAGGPLGFSSGHPNPEGGFDYDGPGWSGEARLAGWWLTDPNESTSTGSSRDPSASIGTGASPAALALGVQFYGTAYGANVTALLGHGGVDLGWSEPARGAFGARTSVAGFVVGAGAVYYFGESARTPGGAALPLAANDLCADIALLVALGYRPVSTPLVAANDIELGPWAATTVVLSLAGHGPYLELFVRSALPGVLMLYWQTTVAVGEPTPRRHVHGAPRRFLREGE